MDLFEKWPGSVYADHAPGNRELQAELRTIYKTRTTQEWLEFATEVNTPIAPVNTPKNIVDDPQFQDRFKLLPHEKHGADMLPFPVHFRDEELPAPSLAPTVGEHNQSVLRDVLGYSDEKIEQIIAAGALGKPT
jgi:crotonobetainyl-CoA:carnitine CoA-transferase CaiB-like acyl-CoA transferase